MANIRLQPKQAQLWDLCSSPASWLGVGGGRGGAKSGGIQRVTLARRLERPGTIAAVVMRNYDQVKRYHIDPMLRDFPELEAQFNKGESKIMLPMAEGPASEIHFTYAESLQDVIRRFRSANYYDILVDQAEQFTEAELREMKQACRGRNAPVGACKFILAFNMGGVGIDFLRRVFYLKEFRDRENPEDFAFIHVFPWDNVEWVRPALEADGLTESDYYLMSEEQRRDYCAAKSDYGRNLNAQDEPLRKRDWFGSWESLEGAFFARAYDRDQTVLAPPQIKALLKPWWKVWISQDWGRGHYCSTHWHVRGEISPAEAKEVLGWEITKPFEAVLTFREYIAGGASASDEGGDRELGERDIAKQIAQRSQEPVTAFWLSPDAFAKRTSANTIAEEEAAILSERGLPAPQKADDDRIGGWALMYNLLLGTKRQAARGETCWFISADCPELVRTLPLLMRDPKNLDDVLKTDKGQARIEQDVADGVRYGLKSMISYVPDPPKEIQRQQAIAEQHLPNLTQVHIATQRFERLWKQNHRPIVRPPRYAPRPT